MGAPVFYVPYVSGTLNNDPFPLREISLGNTAGWAGLGCRPTGACSRSLGLEKPRTWISPITWTITPSADSRRCIDGNYKGGFVTDEGDPWNFQRRFQIVSDLRSRHDSLGGNRFTWTPPTEMRGLVLWEHQHLFPDDWQVQIRAGSRPIRRSARILSAGLRRQFRWTDFMSSIRRTPKPGLHRRDDTTNFTPTPCQQEQFDVARLPGCNTTASATASRTMT